MRKKITKKEDCISKIIICVFVALLVAYCFSSPFIISAIKAENTDRITIVIDAGHGGADGGVQGIKTKAQEKDINLAIAIMLKEVLTARGYDVVMTRTNDAMHEFEGVENNKKRADMYKRAQIIDDAKPVLVVSIHQNYYSAPTRRGAQVFYSKKRENSRALAICLQNALNLQINLTEGGREYAPLCADKYLLECSQYPSVIVECGFLSNFADEKNLLSAQYRMRLCHAIAFAVDEYLTSD